MVQFTTINLQMIMDILHGSKYNIENNTTHVKYTNSEFDIVAKNNSSIIVIDKRDPLQLGNPVVYKDLRTAYNQIMGS